TPAGSTLADAEISGIQVEMMVFSGRPNPGWTLSADEQERVRGLLAVAAPRTAKPIEGRLGYSGFNLRLQTATGQIAVWIYDGVMMAADSVGVTFYQDDRRGLERLLLETSQPHIDPALYQSISDTIPQ
ncbi:MAG TPA: hypothetical protein VD886_18270, partial [Herpetosiphonaceae bacterium]|nr:hypothetical protein [Herpetosiphonaceae bacterium]